MTAQAKKIIVIDLNTYVKEHGSELGPLQLKLEELKAVGLWPNEETSIEAIINSLRDPLEERVGYYMLIIGDENQMWEGAEMYPYVAGNLALAWRQPDFPGFAVALKIPNKVEKPLTLDDHLFTEITNRTIQAIEEMKPEEREAVYAKYRRLKVARRSRNEKEEKQ